MNYYVMQTSLSIRSKPQLVQWAKTMGEAIEYAQKQLELWREVGVPNPPRYQVHYSGLASKTALWDSLD
jgi:hypothetical protein